MCEKLCQPEVYCGNSVHQSELMSYPYQPIRSVFMFTQSRVNGSKFQGMCAVTSAKKVKREQTLCCTIAHPCIQPLIVGKTYARCTVCSFDLCIKHGGYDDDSKHVNSVRHIAKEECLKHASTLSSFLQPSSSGYKSQDLSHSVIGAKTLLSQFLNLMERNLPISAADHVGELFRKKCHQGIQLQSSTLVVT